MRIIGFFTWSLKLQSVTLTACTKGKAKGDDRLKATLKMIISSISNIPKFRPDKIAQVVDMVGPSNNDQVRRAVSSVGSR